MTEEGEQAIVNAVLYAMREGCFFPLYKPKPGADVQQWIKWGAMQNLHNTVAEYSRKGQP